MYRKRNMSYTITINQTNFTLISNNYIRFYHYQIVLLIIVILKNYQINNFYLMLM